MREAPRELCPFVWPENPNYHTHECRYYTDHPHVTHECYLCGDEVDG